MTDLIYPPFTLHGITVGPNLEAAQIGPDSQGLYVRTLQTWLIDLGRSLSGDSFGTFGEATKKAVIAEQHHAGFSETGVVNTMLWERMQTSLCFGPRAVLPPTPDHIRPPFPSAPTFELQLHDGLADYGIDYTWIPNSPGHRDAAVRLFKRLARDSSTPNNNESADLPNSRFWRQQWARFQPTWGRLVGAPWLGVVIEEERVPAEAKWGARPLLREILRAGRNYLQAAINATDLQQRLSNPIRLRFINNKYTLSYSFALHMPMANETTDIQTALAWLTALRDTTPHRILTSNRSLAETYNRESSSFPFISLDAVHDGRPLSHITWMRLHESTDETYSALEKAWPDLLPGRASTPHNEALNTRRRLNIAIGAHLPFGYRNTLPETKLSLINGYVGQVTTATGSHLVACAAVLTCGVDPDTLTVTSQRGVYPEKITLETYLSIFSPENPAFFEALQHSGYACTFLLARALSPGERYNFIVTCASTPTTLSQHWTVETAPSTIGHRGISFLAASCYCDFSSLGPLAQAAGDSYANSVSQWISYTNASLFSFFRPIFKILCGDNIYLDVSPDFLYTESSSLFRAFFLFPKRGFSTTTEIPPLLLEAASSTLGRYLRYTSLSGYARHLAELPSFGIPDDHEFWNDFERKQYHVERSRDHYGIHASTSRDAFRLFQGAMTPSIVETLARATSQPPPVAPPISDLCRSVSFGTENSSGCQIFFLDTTSTRTYKTGFGGKERDAPDQLLAQEALSNLKIWLSGLDRPGIVVVGQPFAVPKEFKLDTPASFNSFSFTWFTADFHASAFTTQFASIIDAISTSAWDITIITGDVHWSRIATCDASDTLSNYINEHGGYVRSNSRLHLPAMHEVISSPAQRLATRESLFSAVYNRPDYDHPRQIHTTAPWTLSDRDHENSRGPRVIAATYESPTFASFRIQPVHKHAARLDVAFCNGEGLIAQRDEEKYLGEPHRLSEDPRDLAHTEVRWLVPNEWVTVKKVPVSLWTSFDIGAAGNPANIRPHYPNGSHDTYDGQGSDHAARLPPITDSGQFVRALEKGERLLVKRVLYQAIRTRRGQAVENEYQCVEVATMNPLTAGHDGMLDQCYFVWSIYNGTTYLAPIKEHLYSLTLRKRLPWFECGDRITNLRNDDVEELWDPDQVRWPENKDNTGRRFEWGHIARAPFTPEYFFKLDKNEEATVVSVFFQAEQVYLAAQTRLAGAYQLLKIKVIRSGVEHSGLYWSVYDGDVRCSLKEQSSEQKVKTCEQRAAEAMQWMRSVAGSSPRVLTLVRYLELFTGLPASCSSEGRAINLATELRLYRGSPLSAQDQASVALLYAWAAAAPVTLIEHIADVVEYNHYLDKERTKDESQGIEEEDDLASTPIEERAYRKLRLGSLRVVMKAEARLGSIFDILLESHALLIKRSTSDGIDYSLLASNMRAILQTAITRPALVTLPPYEPLAAANLVFGSDFPSGLPSTFVLCSPVVESNGELAFSYWPNAEGALQSVQHVPASAFQIAFRAVLHVARRGSDSPATG